MLQPPREGPKFLNTDKPAQIKDFSIQITTILETREVEQLGSFVDLGPKPVLERLFRVF